MTPGCRSWHVLGRAFDLQASISDLKRLGARWQQMGGVWGGSWTGFPDLFHFQWTEGRPVTHYCPDPNDCEAVARASLSSTTPFPWAGFLAAAGLGAAAAAWALQHE